MPQKKQSKTPKRTLATRYVSDVANLEALDGTWNPRVRAGYGTHERLKSPAAARLALKEAVK